jgi:hypothetical protein
MYTAVLLRVDSPLRRRNGHMRCAHIIAVCSTPEDLLRSNLHMRHVLAMVVSDIRTRVLCSRSGEFSIL